MLIDALSVTSKALSAWPIAHNHFLVFHLMFVKWSSNRPKHSNRSIAITRSSTSASKKKEAQGRVPSTGTVKDLALRAETQRKELQEGHGNQRAMEEQEIARVLECNQLEIGYQVGHRKP
jgi:hypothetical protein